MKTTAKDSRIPAVPTIQVRRRKSITPRMFCMQGRYTPMKVPICGTWGWINMHKYENRQSCKIKERRRRGSQCNSKTFVPPRFDEHQSSTDHIFLLLNRRESKAMSSTGSGKVTREKWPNINRKLWLLSKSNQIGNVQSSKKHFVLCLVCSSQRRHMLMPG